MTQKLFTAVSSVCSSTTQLLRLRLAHVLSDYLRKFTWDKRLETIGKSMNAQKTENHFKISHNCKFLRTRSRSWAQQCQKLAATNISTQLKSSSSSSSTTTQTPQTSPSARLSNHLHPFPGALSRTLPTILPPREYFHLRVSLSVLIHTLVAVIKRGFVNKYKSE